MSDALEYIRELRDQRKAYEQFVQDRVLELFLDNHLRERRPPRPFKDSSYLFMRSFNGDNGTRPFSNKVFWLSPDLLVSPLTSPGTVTDTLTTGQTYNLRARVRNLGDMAAPSAKVEFWLTDPSLGFDTRYAEHLTLGRVPTGWIGANAAGEINTTWTVGPQHAGHKCLFARAFAFSPLDLPLHDTALDPSVDRHIAQHNLNIVRQGQPFMFQFIHAPNARAEVEIQPVPFNELLGLAHLIPFEFKPFRDLPQNAWTEITHIDVSDSDARDLGVDRISNGFRLNAFDGDTADIGTLHELRFAVKDVLAEVAAGKTTTAQHRDLLAKFREVTGEARRTIFRMEAPDFGLGEGQAFGLHIRAIDTFDDNPERREVLGGVTLVVTG